MNSNDGIIEGYIKRSSRNRLAFELNDNKGKYSYTKYEKKKSFDPPISLLYLYPQTGRTHQIRVHLSSIEHPILNDKLYYTGKFNINAYHQKYRKIINIILKKIPRIALHAYSLKFTHPTKKKYINLIAPLPRDFKNTLNILSEDYEE